MNGPVCGNGDPLFPDIWLFAIAEACTLLVRLRGQQTQLKSRAHRPRRRLAHSRSATGYPTVPAGRSPIFFGPNLQVHEPFFAGNPSAKGLWRTALSKPGF